ncbi:UPF0280 family protein [Aminobacter sp. Piv2-1]|uniref:UPF0280 family protein n=1 Tax=Aminobacter sp. Piv2-1 TaxID=3031122 RepID=UPI0030AAAAF2
MTGPQANWLPDGRRLHLNHGPIDLVVEAFGDAVEVQAAYRQCAARFETILPELVEELPELRRPTGKQPRPFAGPTARRMEAAVAPLAERFITPMAAVAGSVADEMLEATVLGRALCRAYVNDGGDIALYIAPGERIDAAIAGTGRADRLTIRAEDRVRGIATSGWRGRSFSLGIADAVTVLAVSAAAADAAATLIANAVDLPGHPAIARRPARQLAPDSDLGERPVTTAVGPLSAPEVAAALDAGLQVVEDFRRRGLIEAAALFLGRDARFSGLLPSHPAAAWPSSLRLGEEASAVASTLLPSHDIDPGTEAAQRGPGVGKKTVSMPTKEFDHA